MKLLAIETSGETCSAALLHGRTITERLELAPRRHAELILPMMDGLLADAGLRLTALDGLAFGRGPGSFTGVRIATAVIQGAAFGAGLAVAPVSTLAALALGQMRRTGQHRVLAAFDARMGEVYWGAFERGAHELPVIVGEECVCPPEAVPLPPGTGWFGAGPGWAAHDTTLAARLGPALADSDPNAYCAAQDIARLAEREFAAARQIAPELAEPVYLRNRVTYQV